MGARPFAAALAACLALAPGCAKRLPPPRPVSSAAPPRPAAPPRADTPPALPPAADTQAPRLPREARALQLAAAGELGQALVEWKVLNTVEPQNPEYLRQIAALRTLIRRQVETGLEEGRRALAAGDPERARAAFLDVLRQDPRNRRAFLELRRLEQERLLAAQEAKLERLAQRRSRRAPATPDAGPVAEQERYYLEAGVMFLEQGDFDAAITELEKYLSSYPDDADARAHLEQARTKRQEQAVRQEHVQGAPSEPTRTEPQAAAPTQPLPRTAPSPPPPSPPAAAPPTAASRAQATDLYRQGLRLYRSDLEGAIHLWEQAREQDPDNVKIRLQLEKAYRMQETLERLDGQ